MDQLEKSSSTILSPRLLGEEDSIVKTPVADFSAMQPELPERSLAPSLVVITLSFIAAFHGVANLVVPDYGRFMGMHLLSLGLACASFAILAGVHVYTKSVRRPR